METLLIYIGLGGIAPWIIGKIYLGFFLLINPKKYESRFDDLGILETWLAGVFVVAAISIIILILREL